MRYDGNGNMPDSEIALQGSADHVNIPDGLDLQSAVFVRDGSDLLIKDPDGTTYVSDNYFQNSPLADLTLPDGSSITSNIFENMPDTNATNQLAQAQIPGLEIASPNQPTAQLVGEPIGTVDNLEGSVSVTHVDGTTELLNVGDKVYQGDVLVTETGSGVGITLADTSVFSLGEEGELVLDELVYDPGTQEGSAVISLVEGTASFISGQIAKINPDAVSITTPVATIGIRGTKVFVEYVDGEFKAVNLIETTLNGEQPGEIVIYDTSGTPIGSTNIANVGWSWDQNTGGLPARIEFTPSQLETLTRDALRNLPQSLIEKAVEARELEQALSEAAKIAEAEAAAATEDAQAAAEQAALAKEQARLAQLEAERLLAEAQGDETLLDEALKAQRLAELEHQQALEAEQLALQALAEAERAQEAERLAREAARQAHEESLAALQKATEYNGYSANTNDPNKEETDTASNQNYNNDDNVTVNDGNDTNNTNDYTNINTGGSPSGTGTDTTVGDTPPYSDDDDTPPNDLGTDPTPVEVSYNGVAVDGYLQNAKVFVDFNKDGVLDPNEEYTVTLTDENGNFTLSVDIPASETDYIISVVGGTDKSTGEAFYGSLQAPLSGGASVISPLTTLMANGVSESQLKAIFGLDESINLLEDDPVALATSGSNTTIYSELAAVGVQIQNIIIQAGYILEGASTDLDSSDAAKEIFKTIAEKIIAADNDPQVTFDLSDPYDLKSVITDTANQITANTGVVIDTSKVTDNVDAAAAQISQSNSKIDAAIDAGKTGDDLFAVTSQTQREATDFAETAKNAIENDQLVEDINYTPIPDADVTLSTDEDTPIEITLSQLLGNASDPDNDPMTIENLIILSGGGSLQLMQGESREPAWYYVPDDNYNGDVVFSYDISDGNTSKSTTATLTVNPVNDAPDVGGAELPSGTEGTDYIITESQLLSNASDIDGDSLSIESIISNDIVTVTATTDDPETGERRWIINSSEDGGQSITFSVTDGTDSTSASAWIYFSDANNSLTDDAASVVEGDSLTIDVLANDTLLDGGTITGIFGEYIGDISIVDNQIVYTADDDYSGEDTFSYIVTDDDGATTTATVTMTVTPDADAPNLTLSLGTGSANTIEGGTQVTITVDNATQTGNGYTVTGVSQQTPTETVDNVALQTDDKDPIGFGVSGATSGDTKEIGHDGFKELLVIDFDNPITSVNVAFSWLAQSETAAYALYKGDQLVGVGTKDGLTDKIDPAYTITADDNVSFDRIVFSADSKDDDFLINSVTFEKPTASANYVDIPVNLDASTADSDGSESLSDLTLSGIPDGVILLVDNESYSVTDGTAILSGKSLESITLRVPEDQDNFDLTASVTSTDGQDTATTTQTVNVPEYTFDYYGDDIIAIQSGNLTIDGGEGYDTLLIEAGFDPDLINDNLTLSSIEKIDLLSDLSANDLILSGDSVRDMTDENHLTITIGDNDSLTFADSELWEISQSGEGYTTYSYNNGESTAHVQVRSGTYIDPS
ncbi:cadherin-like domain-containing protein [Terasakiella pusilla]|uniref:cadherin-like domain-containing protein n=1 Tax=Terasakiella pusilla TaxID=64973 RepID=UPI003AA8B223